MLLLGLWELAVVYHKTPYFVPRLGTLAQEILNRLPDYFSGAFQTLIEAVGGFVAGNFISAAVGVWISYSRTAENAVYPYAVAIKATPIVALSPLIVTLFGFEAWGKVVCAALVCFLPLLVQLPNALRQVPEDYVDLFRAFGATKGAVFWQLRLRHGSPQLFAALKTSATLSVVGAVVGELVNPSGGIGKLLADAFTYTKGDELVAGALFAAMTGILLFLVVVIAEQLFAGWTPESI